MTTVHERTPPTLWQTEGAWAEVYEHYLVPRLFGPWGQQLLDRVAPRPGEHVLDVACGTGICARLAAERVGPSGRVVGVDATPAMLAVAAGSTANIEAPAEWLEGDAAALPVPDAAFDLVVCQQGMQFFSDRAAALAEIRRATKPGGWVALSVWLDIERCPGFARLAEALIDHVGGEVGPAMRAPFSLADSGVLRGLLAEAGFADVRITRAFGELRSPSAARFLWEYATAAPWLVEPFLSLGDDARQALTDDYTTTMRPYTDNEGIIFPLEAHVAVARR